MSTSLLASAAQAKTGKTKILVPDSNQPGVLDVTFKDDATAFNGVKHERIDGKGALAAKISAHLFELLESVGLKTCFLGRANASHQLRYLALTMMPLEVVVRNKAFGGFIKRYPQLSSGYPMPMPLVEYFLKDDAAGDPLLSEAAIGELNLLPSSLNLGLLRRRAMQVNEILVAYFDALNIDCADFKLEFGLDAQGDLRIADELSPDNFRLRDKATHRVLDKDVFRQDLGALADAYAEVLNRIEACPPAAFLASWTPALKTYNAEMVVMRRPELLHPEAEAIKQAAESLKLAHIRDFSAGKCFQLTVSAPHMLAAEKALLLLGESLLANPVLENIGLRHLEPFLEAGLE
ncbi:MAG: phosphoribosylaminoimidazolesuccinocarboxamide synthase [Vampirovibrionales bacterium]|nr:phosphoribosylaminoimidazolesuccinocarboxamide synthase [Vampirovibrionales bacterium]